MNTLKTNIRSRLKYLKMTQSQLADKAGLSQAMINKLVTGKVASTTKILELSSALQCQPDWLLYGKGEVSEESNISYAPPVKRMIPVISWVQAGEFCEGNVLALHEVDEWLPCPTSASDKAFGLRVKGDSMTSPHSGDRSYPEGIIIYVDPEAEVTSGRRVIAKSKHLRRGHV